MAGHLGPQVRGRQVSVVMVGCLWMALQASLFGRDCSRFPVSTLMVLRYVQRSRRRSLFRSLSASAGSSEESSSAW